MTYITIHACRLHNVSLQFVVWEVEAGLVEGIYRYARGGEYEGELDNDLRPHGFGRCEHVTRLRWVRKCGTVQLIQIGHMLALRRLGMRMFFEYPPC